MKPSVSVIVPTYNAEKTIARLIKALLKQNYPKKKYEIIIADDGSTDSTTDFVSKYPVKLLRLPHRGPASARNVGAKKAKGAILLFTDADCVPDRNWIKNMIKPFENPVIVGVSGTYRTLNREKFMARFVGLEIAQRHESMKKQKYIDFIGTFSAGYRKNIFLKFGGYDTSFKTSSGEDPELSYRIAKAGLKMAFQSTAFVYHPHPDTLWKYLKQKYQRAVWRNWMYWGKHKGKIISDSYTHRMLLPQAILAGILGLILLGYLLGIFLYKIDSFLPFCFIIILLSFIPFFQIDLIYFFSRHEKLIAVAAPFIFIFRSFSVALGILFGSIKYLFRER